MNLSEMLPVIFLVVLGVLIFVFIIMQKSQGPARLSVTNRLSKPQLESGEWQVQLTATGRNKIEVIKVIRRWTGLGLKESKDLTDSVPCDCVRDVSLTSARQIQYELEEAGASVRLQSISGEVATPERLQEDGITLVLLNAGNNKINVIKEVRAMTDLGLAEAKELVEHVPSVVLKNLTSSQAEVFKERLEQAGALAKINN